MSIVGAFVKSVPSKMGRIKLASSPSSETGPTEEPPSEASDDSLDGNASALSRAQPFPDAEIREYFAYKQAFPWAFA